VYQVLDIYNLRLLLGTAVLEIQQKQ